MMLHDAVPRTTSAARSRTRRRPRETRRAAPRDVEVDFPYEQGEWRPLKPDPLHGLESLRFSLPHS